MAKKAYSQNFLADPAILQQIAASVPVSENDTVLEIGAGRGALTQALLERSLAQLVAVEVDPSLISGLRQRFKPDPRFSLQVRNILGVFPESMPALPVHVIGNLPYHMTGQILFHFCGELTDCQPVWRPYILTLTLMVQREVADRLLSQPGDRFYNPLSIAIQNWFHVRRVLDVSARAFRPVPKVESTVVQLSPRPAGSLLAVDQLQAVHKLIRAGFRQPRKTLKNNLLAAFQATDVIMIDTNLLALRPHCLTPDDWRMLAELLVTPLANNELQQAPAHVIH